MLHPAKLKQPQAHHPFHFHPRSVRSIVAHRFGRASLALISLTLPDFTCVVEDPEN